MCEPAQSAVVTHIDMVLRLILEFPVMRFRCREGFEVPEVIFRIPDHIWRRHLHRTSFTPLGGCCHYALECAGGARCKSLLGSLASKKTPSEILCGPKSKHLRDKFSKQLLLLGDYALEFLIQGDNLPSKFF